MAYNYIIDTGIVVADTSTLLTDVQNEFKAALGANINLAASTPQGTLIAAEVIARSNVMRAEAEVANVINPNYSYGTFLDAICGLMAIERGVDEPTRGTGLRIVGNPGTTVSAGSRVQTAAGDIFSVDADVLIPSLGSAFGNVTSQSPGQVLLPQGQLRILDNAIGWTSITVLPTTVVNVGTSALSDAQLKSARLNQLAIQGLGSTMAIKAGLSALPGVTSVNVVENNTGAVGVVNGITFTLPNAIWVCVAGPIRTTQGVQMVSDALWLCHQGGVPFDYGATGNGTPVNPALGTPVIDPASGYRYNVKWTFPIDYDGYVKITVKQGASAATPETIQASVVNWSQGKMEGESGLVVGASLSAFEVAAAVSRDSPGLYVQKVEVNAVLAGGAVPTTWLSEYVAKPFDLITIMTGRIQVIFV